MKNLLIKSIITAGYFLALFLIGSLLTGGITYLFIQVFPEKNPQEITTIAGILIFSTLTIIDMLLIYHKKISPSIIVMALPFIIGILIKSFLQKTSKPAAGIIQDTFKHVEDKIRMYGIRSIVKETGPI
ncbi:hypothetical protein [Methanolapillus ohkumae]|uniref:Uncharacterized protein n=1 Tax=Methanolapillus ohkumae TaxID=3028298 RepID=A0AA96ZWZ6_9EURY|nr:hypothetical protein MsAm2_09320 [Methanosarcinaceae archaeon Am2]